MNATLPQKPSQISQISRCENQSERQLGDGSCNVILSTANVRDGVTVQIATVGNLQQSAGSVVDGQATAQAQTSPRVNATSRNAAAKLTASGQASARAGVGNRKAGDYSRAKRYRASGQGTISLSLGTEKGLNRLMELTVQCNNQSLLALVDSGATHCFASARCVASLGLSPCASDGMVVRLANGLRVRSQGTVELLCELAPQLEQFITFQVVPELSMPLILGMPWLKQFNPQINWNLGTLSFPSDKGQIDICTSVSSVSGAERASVETCGKRAIMKTVRKSRQPAWCGLLRAARTSELTGQLSHASGGTDARRARSDVHERGSDRIVAVVEQFPDVFAEPKLPVEREIKHRIDLVDELAMPPRRRVYRMSEPELAECRKQLDAMLAKGWIKPSVSPFGAPVLFARKKDGGLRMCVDYRLLNANTKLDQFPMPRVDDILDSLSGSTVFSKIDLQQGYHQVAIEPGHEFKTAFSTRWGLFEFCVLPFGLTNAPATFQRLMNSVFREKLGVFVLVYLDDILIYSRTVSEHCEHLQWVLQQLQDHGLRAKRTKCEFGLQSIEYLGHIVSGAGVKPDPDKLSAVRDWPEPSSVKEVQQFLGLANYYNRFVRDFAHIATPLTALLQKGVDWDWSQDCSAAFQKLKEALCSSPVLVLPDMSRDFVLETDASDYAVGAILEQDQGQGLQPVAYYSRKLRGAELNYPTHDRELMAIFLAVKKWRPYFDGKSTRVITDHRPLEHLHTQPNLSRRQVRWLEFLGEFVLQFEYRPGRLGEAPDALSRINTLVCEPGWLGRVYRYQIDASDREMVKLRARASSSDAQFRLVDREGLSILYRIYGDRQQLVIPAQGGLRQVLLGEMHDAYLSGHLGARKTRLALQQRVWWPYMERDITRYIKSCPICQRVKDSTSLRPGLLQPLQVPTERFESWSMDFITGLPAVRGANCIYTCVDRLTKLVRLTPCWMGDDALAAGEVARLFFDRVIRDFGVPREIISDRDPRWTSAFWRALMAIMCTRLAFSTAFHPQSDGQTERAHRVIEQVIRAYLLDAGVDWLEVLGHCEFALNSSVSESTGVSPFELVYGQPVREVVDHLDGQHRVQAAQDVVTRAQELVESARQHIARAQEYQRRAYDKRHRELSFSVGDQVLLSTQNLSLGGTRKLTQRWIGPFRVLECIGSCAYRLDLPGQYSQLHPVFHVSLLRPYVQPDAAQAREVALPVVTVTGETEYEVERILRHRRRGRASAYQYLVQWRGYDISEATWEPAAHLEHAQDCVDQYWAARQ